MKQIFLLLVAIALLSCGKSKPSSPKEIARLVVKSLKENDPEQLQVIMATGKDKREVYREYEKALKVESLGEEEIWKMYEDDQSFEELKRRFYKTRRRFGEDFWKDVQVVSYSGIGTHEVYGIRQADVHVQLKRLSTEFVLRIGQVYKIRGQWVLLNGHELGWQFNF